MSERWIHVSEKVLAQLTTLETTNEKDRLELVSSLRFIMNILQRSLVGWMQWITNPEIMTVFSKADLEQMTRLGLQKGLKVPKKVVKNGENRTEHFYV